MWCSTLGCIKPQPGLLTHLPLAQPATGCLQCSMPIAKEQHYPGVGNRSLKDGHTQNDTWKMTARSPKLGFSRNQCAVVGHCLRSRFLFNTMLGPSQVVWVSPSANWNAGYTPCLGKCKRTAEHPEGIRNAEVPTPELQGPVRHLPCVCFPLSLCHWVHGTTLTERGKSCLPLRAASHPALHISSFSSKRKRRKMKWISVMYVNTYTQRQVL